MSAIETSKAPVVDARGKVADEGVPLRQIDRQRVAVQQRNLAPIGQRGDTVGSQQQRAVFGVLCAS